MLTVWEVPEIRFQVFGARRSGYRLPASTVEYPDAILRGFGELPLRVDLEVLSERLRIPSIRYRAPIGLFEISQKNLCGLYKPPGGKIVEIVLEKLGVGLVDNPIPVSDLRGSLQIGRKDPGPRQYRYAFFIGGRALDFNLGEDELVSVTVSHRMGYLILAGF